MDSGNVAAAPFHAGWQASRDCALCVQSARRVSPSQPMYEMMARRAKVRLVIRVISGKELGTQGDETLEEGSALLGKQKMMWQERRDLLHMEGLMRAGLWNEMQASGANFLGVGISFSSTWGVAVIVSYACGAVDQARSQTVKRSCATDQCADIWREAQTALGGSWPDAFSLVSQAIGCCWNFWFVGISSNILYKRELKCDPGASRQSDDDRGSGTLPPVLQ